MWFSRQEYWSGCPFLSPGDLPDPGMEPGSPALQADLLPSEPRRSPKPSKEGTVMNPVIPIRQLRKLRNRELEKFAQGHTELMARWVSDPQIWISKNKLLSASLLISQFFLSFLLKSVKYVTAHWSNETYIEFLLYARHCSGWQRHHGNLNAVKNHCFLQAHVLVNQDRD